MEDNSEMLEHYDFNNGVRGKYAEKYKQGSNVVILDSDSWIFSSSKLVNSILRAISQILQNSQNKVS